MSEPNWAKVLFFIYGSNQISILAEIKENHIIVEETDLDVEEVDGSLKTLQKWGLIKKEAYTAKGLLLVDSDTSIPDEESEYVLTEKGFNVAHDREQNKKSQRINDSIRGLTVILAIAALIQAVSAVATVDKPEVFVVIVGSVIFLLIGFLLLHYDWY